MTYDSFRKTVWQYYTQNKRDLPWRDIEHDSIRDRGYKVIVSEVMLQQTQVRRVTPKYLEWMQRWPTIEEFSAASLSEVLKLWSGLGYNRRAKYLYNSLRSIYNDFNGIIPNDVTTLSTLPGIGINTAGAIIVYTYNTPLLFIETNIRSVYLHAFFANTTDRITDSQIKDKLASSIDINNPRHWYYALMDYGSYVKQQYGSHLQKSMQHKKQSSFEGSNRQIRGTILRKLIQQQPMQMQVLKDEIADSRLDSCVQAMLAEGLIIIDGDTLRLPHG